VRIYIIYRGPFGEQITNNLALKGFAEMISGIYELKPETIEEEYQEEDLWNKVWEEPAKYVPKSLPIKRCDLLLVLGIHSKLGDFIPPIAEKLGAKAVLYPIDDKQHAPEARKTVEEDLRAKGIHVEFPEPFCVLEGSEDPMINEFAQHFGRPKFKIISEGSTIHSVEVLRDTPCGSATSVAKKMVGFSCANLKALKEKLFSEHHNEENENYCLAEMDPLHPYMQEAGDILVDAFFEACGVPTLQELILKEIESTGKLDLSILKSKFVDEEKRCETGMTIERVVDELVRKGKIPRDLLHSHTE